MSSETEGRQTTETVPPDKDEFVEQAILWPDDAEWVWHGPTNSPKYILAIEEVHKHHYALVLGQPDGTFDTVETFHDSDNQFLRYPPGGEDV